jgi:hypothetical protein
MGIKKVVVVINLSKLILFTNLFLYLLILQEREKKKKFSSQLNRVFL